VPRGAEIAPPAGDGAAPAVVARHLSRARLAGFRIAGPPEAPLAVGVRVLDSAVEMEDLEVTGAARAGIEILGGGRAMLRLSHVHDNPGVGGRVGAGAAPRLLDNLIAGNGRGPGGPRPGVEIAPDSRPQLANNRIVGNGGPQVVAPSAAAAAEIFGWNDFGGVAREQAVRPAAGAPVAPGAPPSGAAGRPAAPARPGAASRRP
jgi:hypothetical protein